MYSRSYSPNLVVLLTRYALDYSFNFENEHVPDMFTGHEEPCLSERRFIWTSVGCLQARIGYLLPEHRPTSEVLLHDSRTHTSGDLGVMQEFTSAGSVFRPVSSL
jgi:hypothetical protein